MQVRYLVDNSPARKALASALSKQIYRGQPLIRLIRLGDALVLVSNCAERHLLFAQSLLVKEIHWRISRQHRSIYWVRQTVCAPSN